MSTPADMRLPLDFSGRVCLITGAARGIGRAIARVFAAHGGIVTIVDRASTTAAQVADEIRAAGGQAKVLQADLSERSAVFAAVEHVQGEAGRLDVIVHNAAFFPLTAFEAIDEETLDRTLAVNLKAAFWLAQAALPAFKRAGRGRCRGRRACRGRPRFRGMRRRAGLVLHRVPASKYQHSRRDRDPRWIWSSYRRAKRSQGPIRERADHG